MGMQKLLVGNILYFLFFNFALRTSLIESIVYLSFVRKGKYHTILLRSPYLVWIFVVIKLKSP